MEIKYKINSNALIISICGELDEYSAFYAKNKIDNIIKDFKVKQIVFDMSELDFMDSTGIGVLLGRYKILKNRNISAFIKNTNSHVEKIFKMSGIYQVMPKIS